MSESITASFVITEVQKKLLKRWSKEDDRTLSATLRQILEREVQRRAAKAETTRKMQKQK